MGRPRGSCLPETLLLAVALAVALAATADSAAGLQAIDLATYTHTATYTLFVVGDAAQAVAQYSLNGVLLD